MDTSSAGPRVVERRVVLDQCSNGAALLRCDHLEIANEHVRVEVDETLRVAVLCVDHDRQLQWEAEMDELIGYLVIFIVIDWWRGRCVL